MLKTQFLYSNINNVLYLECKFLSELSVDRLQMQRMTRRDKQGSTTNGLRTLQRDLQRLTYFIAGNVRRGQLVAGSLRKIFLLRGAIPVTPSNPAIICNATNYTIVLVVNLVTDPILQRFFCFFRFFSTCRKYETN